MNGKTWELRCRECGKRIMVPRGKGAFLRNNGVLFEGETPKRGKVICKNCGALVTAPIFLK